MSDQYTELERQYNYVCDILADEQEEIDRLSKLVGEYYTKWKISEEENKKLREENLELQERVAQMEWAMGL